MQNQVRNFMKTSERKLASIQKIKSLAPIPNANQIIKATVLGWELVVRKDEFKVGDICIYCEVDSVMPERPEFEFLRPRGFRIKTVKLRGQISQGVCFPVSILPNTKTYEIGDDVTELLGITKREVPIPAQLAGEVKGVFPEFIPKTDETRVQVLQEMLDKYAGTQCYITEKLDGSSSTFFINDDEFGVCSRNLQLKLTDKPNWFYKILIYFGFKSQPKGRLSNTLIRLAEELQIEQKLRALKRNIAIQGEIIGEGIQKNRYDLKGQKIFFFNAFDIDRQSYFNFNDFTDLINQLQLQSVPFDRFVKLENDISALVELSKGGSWLNLKTQREGVVIRPVENIGMEISGRFSFKVINPEFLLKYDE